MAFRIHNGVLKGDLIQYIMAPDGLVQMAVTDAGAAAAAGSRIIQHLPK
jgi:hypothetical protein